MNETNRKLISLVLDKTNEKLLTWSRSSSANEFKTELNSATLNIALSFSDAFNPLRPIKIYSVNMYNGTGAPISLAHEEDGDPDINLLSQLYHAAKDSCTRETETISNLFEELNSLGVIEG